MGRLLQVVTLLVSIAPSIALAQPKAPAPAARPDTTSDTVKLPSIETFTLANGLQVAVLPSDNAPVVAVQVWYRAGSKDEPRDRRGSAHMFEHMLFKGTQHVRAEAHAQFLNGLGGYVNATTDEEGSGMARRWTSSKKSVVSPPIP